MFDQQVTFVYTRDLEAATRFYEGALGLRLALDQGACRIYHTAPGAFLGVCRSEGMGERAAEDAPVILTLVTQDVDGWYARLVAQGVASVKPPQHNQQYNIYHCFLRDPEGYLIEIQRFLDPAWPRVSMRW
jgi:catechol 2,3-dioxygenase-like lactoylglutathione lyase family enzyme